jgi:hypothetical protein
MMLYQQQETDMGWWGVNVMEGDPPMDAEADIVDILHNVRSDRGLEYADPYDEEGGTELWDTLKIEGVASKVLAVLSSEPIDELTARYHNIQKQVLGEIIVCHGFPMPDDVRQAAIQAAKDDDWAAYADDRKQAMEVYAKRIADYNGTAVEPVSQGLFGKIFG